MNKATKLIDSIIQEHAEDISPLLIQKLGELRDMMTINHTGDVDTDNIATELNEAIHNISDKRNADLINITLLIREGGTDIGSSICIRHSSNKEVTDCVMTIPAAMSKIVSELDKSIPGFRMRITMLMMMKDKMHSDPMDELKDLLGDLGKNMKL